MRRRTLLRRGMVLAALGLAGCTGQPGSGEEPTGIATTATVAGAQPTTASATERPTPSPTPAPTDTPPAMTTSSGGYERPAPAETATSTASPTATSTATATPAAGQTVVVGPGGDFSFSPSSFEIGVGETVVWTWDSSNHNVRPSAQPDGADWSGTPGTEGSTYDEGYSYAYTFEIAGSYEYYCAPHRSLGMTGSFEVV